MSCSLLLDYPDEQLPGKLATIREACTELPAALREPIEQFCTTVETTGIRGLQEHYVDNFDQKRRCALWLTYYTHGDTRARGQALLAFREVMRRSGFDMGREELADYLPAVLEFCALEESDTGEKLLESNREGLEVVRAALHKSGSPYAVLLDALLAILPQADARTIEAYQKLISQGPPSELVGLDMPSVPPYASPDASALGRPAPTTSERK
ncbi:nitrate reductase molybdenum cofactor assembly chaperone [Propionibacterium cyclohexanicum]